VQASIWKTRLRTHQRARSILHSRSLRVKSLRMQSWLGSWLGMLGLALVAGAVRAEEVIPAEPAAVREVVKHDFVFPRQRQVDGLDLVMHAPQIRSWPGFERFAALMAVEVTPTAGGAVRYATATVQGSTEVDLANRVVRVIEPEFTNVSFAGAEVPPEYRAPIQHASRDDVLEIPLDLFLASVADDVLSDPPPAGFNVEPPAIAVIIVTASSEYLRSAATSPIGSVGSSSASPIPNDSRTATAASASS